MADEIKKDFGTDVEVMTYDDEDIKLEVDKSKVQTSGTVQLTAGKIVYIPAPTADPQGECLDSDLGQHRLHSTDMPRRALVILSLQTL